MIAVVSEANLAELLPLVRAYCSFYEVVPTDEALLEMSRALIADPEREGLQLIARDASGNPIGYASLFWSWNTLSASRIGVRRERWLDYSLPT